MSDLVKIVVPDAGPINTLAAANLLHLLLAPPNSKLVVVESVFDEIIVRSSGLKRFMDEHEDRIEKVQTFTCRAIKERLSRGEVVERGRGDLAVADFLLYHVDDVVGNSPALLISEDRKLVNRLSKLESYTQQTHFITTAAYLRKLELEEIIVSFDDIWKLLVDKNASPDLNIHREPNTLEREIPTENESRIFPSKA